MKVTLRLALEKSYPQFRNCPVISKTVEGRDFRIRSKVLDSMKGALLDHKFLQVCTK